MVPFRRGRAPAASPPPRLSVRAAAPHRVPPNPGSDFGGGLLGRRAARAGGLVPRPGLEADAAARIFAEPRRPLDDLLPGIAPDRSVGSASGGAGRRRR